MQNALTDTAAEKYKISTFTTAAQGNNECTTLLT